MKHTILLKTNSDGKITNLIFSNNGSYSFVKNPTEWDVYEFEGDHRQIFKIERYKTKPEEFGMVKIKQAE
jgi:two-component SAPR family response regulator